MRGCFSIFAGLALWEILARWLLENELLIAPPASVMRSFWRLTASGELYKHFEATLIEFGYGYAAAGIAGVLLGYFTGMSKRKGFSMRWQNDIRRQEFGVMECWSNGVLGLFRTPSLHHSSTPVLQTVTATLLVCFAASLLIASTAHAQPLKRIKIGYPSLSFRQSNVWVARELGLFNKYGLEVEPILFRGGQVATQALVSGDPPIVNIGTVVQATIQGHNLVLTAAVENKYDLIVFTRPGITQLEQLKGKKIGITGFNSATHYASIIVARHIGAELKELTLIPAGLDTERIASVTAGVLDATYVATSAAPLARKAGLTEIISVGDLGVEVQGNGFATSRAYIASNRDVVKSALKGFVEAIYLIYSNKPAAQKVFAKYMRTSNPEVLEDSYNGYIKSIPKKPYPTLKGIQFMLDVLAPTLPNAKNFKPEQFVDLSFLQELEKEGFFTEMAKRYPTK